MADVSISPPDPDRLRGEDGFRDANRGQLLLVAGLVMAVSLVALVVLLNATIYSENVATRGIEATDGEALEVRATAVEGTGSLIDATNRKANADDDDYTVTRGAVEDGVAELDTHLARTYAGRGGVTHLAVDSLRRGSYLTGNLSSASVADDVNRTRGFVLDVDVSDDPPVGTNASAAPDEAFHVVFNHSTGDTHEVYVYANETESGNLTVAVGDDGTEPTVLCSVDPADLEDSDRVAVDLTGERVGGQSCPGIWPAELVSQSGSYAIDFENGDAATGNATATVTAPSGGSVGSELDATPAVYDATIDLRYRTAELRFETVVRVAPGEPDV